MEHITKERVLAIHKKKPRRKQFSKSSGVQKNKREGRKSTFSVSFAETIKALFEHDNTNLKLRYSKQHKNYWCYLDTEKEIKQVEKWEQEQGTRVFLRDCLSLSIALDVNSHDSKEHEKTDLGTLEYQAKYSQDKEAIDQLAQHATDFIRRVAFYRDADFLCAVPTSDKKDFHLPKELAQKISHVTHIPDITPHISVSGDKGKCQKRKNH